jgi:Mu transposase, C-terminal domain/Helix-turn-helix domain
MYHQTGERPVAYREIGIMDLWEVLRRWHDRQNISQIAHALGYDRKTVRGHIRRFRECGLSPGLPLPAKEEVLSLFTKEEHPTGRTSSAQSLLEPYLDEIAKLVNDPELGLTAKSAFSVISQRHELHGKVSYSSFKRFARSHRIEIDPGITTCRIEVPPGSEVQVDYAKVALLFDPRAGKRRSLYAFIGTLSHSRHKYIELTFGQDQVSFVSSHVRMFEFFGGVPERVVIDNLKSGVIRPDLYDPTFNRTYREMAEHYGCFIDTARIRKPRDKGKVERDVQTVREAVRTQMVLSPGMTLGDLSQAIRHWILHEYGERLHGTTREKSIVVFNEREKGALKPLPGDRFEISTWKQATVHPDHYIQFNRKTFSVPSSYVTKKVWIRASEHLLQVFYNEQLIAQHVITRAYRHTDQSHFPTNLRVAVDRSAIHRSLLERASRIGEDLHQLVGELFEVNAFVNLRRAQGIVSLAEELRDSGLVNRAVCFMREHHIRPTPRDLRAVIEKLRAESQQMTLDELSNEYVRDISYFINNQQGTA